MNHKSNLRIALTVLVSSLLPATAFGGVIDEDWVIFEDFVSGAECGIINASNAEFIALFDTGTMVIVSGADTRFDELIVTSDDEVLFNGQPSGFVEFLDDGDGLPAVFWTTLVGTIVEVDTLTGEPFDSGILPEDRINTGCDACDFIDDSIACDDFGNGDGGNNGGGGNGGGGGDVFFPVPCGAFSPATLVLLTLALPFAKMRRTRRRQPN